MSLGEIAGLLTLAWIGYLVVSYLMDHLSRGGTPQRPRPRTEPPRATADAPRAAPPPRPDDIDRSWYRTLDVREAATLDEVTAAYRRKITQYHPDKVATLGPELRELAEAKSKQLNEAYAHAKAIKSR